jgi:hypothetical protein
MRCFLLGALAVYATLAAWAAWDVHATFSTPWSERQPFVTVLLCVGVLPLAGAWAGAELARAIRRPALFARRAGRSAKFALGLTGAALSTVPMIAAMAWATMSDATITAASAGAFGFLVVLPLRRRRRGACRGCGYDLSSMPAPSQPGFGLCPECGAPVMG